MKPADTVNLDATPGAYQLRCTTSTTRATTGATTDERVVLGWHRG